MWQAAPPVRVRDLPEAWHRHRFPLDSFVRPCYRRLAIGFSHCVVLLLMVNCQALEEVASLLWRDVKLLVLNRDEIWQHGAVVVCCTVDVYVHVDDFGIFPSSAVLSDRVAATLALVLNRIGFLVIADWCGSVERYIGLRPLHAPALFLPVPGKLACCNKHCWVY